MSIVVMLKGDNFDQSVPDEYTQIFLKNEINSIQISPISFHFFNEQMLENELRNKHEDYWSLVVTSPRAASVLANLFSKYPFLFEIWNKKSIFAVFRFISLIIFLRLEKQQKGFYHSKIT